jgi:hypothetical protein
MKSIPWDRAALIDSVRHNLWRYLTPSANIEQEFLEAAALLQMPGTEVRLLGAIQFLISDELGSLLDYVPFLLRRLATTTAHEEEFATERIRGPIQWAQTVPLQAATGTAGIFVTAPSRRAYQTPENELLVFLLDQTVTLGRFTGWDRTPGSFGVGALVRDRVATAVRWSHSRMLVAVERRPVDSRRLGRIRQGRARRRYQPVLDAWNRYAELVDRLDRASIRQAVETYGLASRSDPTLFELSCLFSCLQALAHNGWRLGRIGLFAGGVRVRSRRDDEQLDLVYQSTPRELNRVSLYGAVQADHGIHRSSLRPDLVLRRRHHNTDHWVLVEVKGGTRPVEDSARAAAVDLLAYRAAFAPILSSTPEPYGLGIAWGSHLTPQDDHGIMLCTPDTLEQAVAGVFG